MFNPVRAHYQSYPYPHYPLIASVRRCDTYALNFYALWSHFNHTLPPPEVRNILIAGCGTFAPYPCSVANPDVPITALDLSERALRRARWHCVLHGRRNVAYHCGDLLEHSAPAGKFGLIDSFGVLHHLKDPLAGLKELERLLAPGGILRIMLYSRYARKDEESIRRAFRLLGVDTADCAKRLLKRAPDGSRLAGFLAASDEVATVSGLADALLHPCVHTYRIDDILEMVSQTGLSLQMFAHPNACENPADEIARLRDLEKERLSPGNFVLYLSKKNVLQVENADGECMIMLNPCLVSAVNCFKLGTLHVDARIGVENPELTYRDRSFLRQFIAPVRSSALTVEETKLANIYKRLLFLVEFRN